MKKKTIIILIILCMIVAFIPTVSRAAVSPHFIAVNDTLLPFNDDNMPFVGESTILVPYNILSMVDVWAITSAGFDQVQLHKGSKRVFFNIEENTIQDQDGNTLNWPPPQRVRGRYYVPLHQVCEFFGLTYELVEVGRDVIPNTQIWLIRIITSASLSRSEFIARYRSDMVAAYNEYYKLNSSSPGITPTAPPSEEPPPNYSDVTIRLSFHDISAGSTEHILDMLDSDAVAVYQSCFFVTANDIVKNPGLIRMLNSKGHTVGIWLVNGTYQEYLATSALLFEATKLKTVLVSADAAEEMAIRTANARGLLYWGDSWRTEIEKEDADESGEGDMSENDDEETTPEITVTDALPTVSGEQWNLMQDCSEDTAAMLPEVLLVLQLYNYTVTKITETVPPAW